MTTYLSEKWAGPEARHVQGHVVSASLAPHSPTVRSQSSGQISRTYVELTIPTFQVESIMARYIQKKKGSFAIALKMPPSPANLVPEPSKLETPREGHDAVRVNAAMDSAQTFQIRTIQLLDGCPKQCVIPV